MALISISLFLSQITYSQDGAFKMEAEEMTLSGGFVVENGGFASEGSFVGSKDGSGSAISDFVGSDKKYKVNIGYFDENDGTGTLEVLINNLSLGSWTLNENKGVSNASAESFVKKSLTAEFIDISNGAKIEIKGTKNNGEHARVDYLEFIPIDGKSGLPEVEIFSPNSGTIYNSPAKIAIEAIATDPDSVGISKVEFYHEKILIGTDYNEPYILEWENVVKGKYSITAKAYDLGGSSGTSLPISLNVLSEGTGSCETPFAEKNGVLVMQAEGGEFTNSEYWLVTNDTSGYTGQAYIQWNHPETYTIFPHGTDQVNYSFSITKPGTYRFRWRTKINKVHPTKNPQHEHNDTYVRFPDAKAFGIKNDGGIYYPAGGVGVPPGSNIIYKSSGGWFKVFTGYKTNLWSWDSRCNDSETIVFVTFDAPGTYQFQIGARSVGHAIDKITLQHESVGGDPYNTSDETLCTEGSGNKLPSVSITSPANKTKFEEGVGSIPITANASDPDGSISKVEFYNGNTKIGEKKSAPFSISIPNPENGVYLLSAKATDNKGVTITSSGITVGVGNVDLGSVKPSANITSPGNNSEVEAGKKIRISANASGGSGGIKKVTFFANGQKIGEDFDSGFGLDWTPNIPGEYELTTWVEDNKGNVGFSNPVKITVFIKNSPPVISLISPVDYEVIDEGENLKIIANAADNDGSISKVIFYEGANVLQEVLNAPYEFEWETPAIGNYEITAKAIDDEDEETVTEVVNITVNALPTVSISTPQDSEYFGKGTNLEISAVAEDTDGTIAEVQFFYGETLIGSDETAPFAVTWENLPAGEHELTAKVIDDNGGEKMSEKVKITVNILPIVSIKTPVKNAIITKGDLITLEALATDEDGTIFKVIFYDGEESLGEVETAPFKLDWENAGAGLHSLKAVAIDNNGGESVSEIVQIKINIPPSVSLVKPTANDQLDLGQVFTIEAGAEDPDGEIKKIEFYANDELIGEDKIAPYKFNWKSLETGEIQITAKAYDNENAITISELVTIIVNMAPEIKIIKPGNGSSVLAETNLVIEVELSDRDGTIEKVVFYDGEDSLGVSTSEPFSFTIKSISAGEHILKAVAFDNLGQASESNIVEIKATSNIPPEVEIVKPSDQALYNEDEEIVLEANASDSDGNISKVEFYSGATLLREVFESPYLFNWKEASSGEHIITAKAYDNEDGISVSQDIKLTINSIPVVSITSPIKDGDFVPGKNILIEVNAEDDGTIQKVVFYANDQKLGESATAPYSFEWAKPSAGIYELYATALDENDGIGQSQLVKISVKDLTASPVSIISITKDTIVAPEVEIPIATKITEGYEVEKVEFYLDGNKVGEDSEKPFEFNLLVGKEEGEHKLTIKAYHSGGKVFESGELNITIQGVLGINEANPEEIGFNVYPNPSVEKVYVILNSDQSERIDITLSNAIMQTVQENQAYLLKPGENRIEIEIKNFKPGIYIMSLEIDGKRYTKKFLKK
ncbi:Ig-like domain-containing protein [Flexithrix dorotheae]|uniref:Ig-like domain-containing protein n=1 Tax=Flexithrix dorotheae TaxID=70993 RepID=UPI00146BBF18|nr:Ig-like domain-containing protein [Flexithrix dorotheae]